MPLPPIPAIPTPPKQLVIISLSDVDDGTVRVTTAFHPPRAEANPDSPAVLAASAFLETLEFIQSKPQTSAQP